MQQKEILMKTFALVLSLLNIAAWADPSRPSLPQTACSKDLSDFCGDVPLDKDRLTLCLMKNESRLSATCAKDMVKKKQRFLKQEPCAQDLISKCYDEHTQEAGKSVRCLFKNTGKLQPQCEKNIAVKMSKMRKQNPCFDDTEKHCPSIVNRGEIHQCLSQKTALLGRECQMFMKHEAELAQNNPCHQDLKLLCRSGLKPSGLAKCLEENSSKLSPACKTSYEAKKGKREELKQACEADRKKFCSGPGKIVDCLKKHRANLNMTCSLLLPK